jgi:hypothetical protein
LNVGDTSSVNLTYTDSTGVITADVLPAGVDHNSLANLATADPHTLYALLGGRATPQHFAFGTAASAITGYLTSTVHGTKGKYFLNAAGTITVDEFNLRFGIGTAEPSSICVAQFDVASTGSLGDPVQEPVFRIANYDNVGAAYIQCLVGAGADVAGGIRVKHVDATSGNAYLSFILGSSNDERIRIDKDGNIGFGITTFGTNAVKVLGIGSGTAPTTGVADSIQVYSSDIAAGHTEPSFFCEGTQVLATGQADSASSVRVKMRINGTEVTLLAI